MVIKLKPCPFCGGVASLREYGMGHRGTGEFIAHYEVGCDKCKLKFQFESVFTLQDGQPKFKQNGFELCIATWNRRSDDGQD